ncbi:MAG: type II toxin-antitoxin system RelB/DinJ family antitoxin [Acidobacteriota bacterium]|nr:type II toxin-antitoxin system RelB/DinJ family antitoxin [Acidobacteriota bacterium]
MAAMATVQAQVELDVERRAAEVLRRDGITVEDAVRSMLTRTAEEGVLPFNRDRDVSIDREDNPEHDVWFRAKVHEALDDPRPPISREELDRRMAARRADALARMR